MPKAKKAKLGRRESRDLDVEIGFLEGLVSRDPQYVEALQLLADDYTRRGRINDGLRVDHQLKSLRPGDPEVLFNLACSLSLAGELGLAIDELLRAVDAGYRDLDWMLKDPDLAAARKDPAFRKVRDRIQALKAGD